jgi:hypothetical protein
MRTIKANATLRFSKINEKTRSKQHGAQQSRVAATRAARVASSNYPGSLHASIQRLDRGRQEKRGEIRETDCASQLKVKGKN